MASTDKESLRDEIIDVLKNIYDPEIPVPIWDLGLIYELEISEDNEVFVEMTLTAPNCPAADILPGQVESRISELPDVKSVELDLVFEPPYSPDMMTDEARMQLGMM